MTVWPNPLSIGYLSADKTFPLRTPEDFRSALSAEEEVLSSADVSVGPWRPPAQEPHRPPTATTDLLHLRGHVPTFSVWVSAYLGTLTAGAVAAPLPQLFPTQFLNELSNSLPSQLLVARGNYPTTLGRFTVPTDSCANRDLSADSVDP